jgi:hypothetical protein
MAARQQREPEKEQYCNVECECGHKIGTYFRHYEIGRCSCGRPYWALQPKRGGPLVLFPWPGDWRMQAAKEAAKENAYVA